MSVAYLPKAYIRNYYHTVSVFEKLKDKMCNTQKRRSGEMSDFLFETYKILSCHMEIIYFRKPLACRGKFFVHIQHQNMHFHIGNVFCVVVSNSLVLIFQVQNQIIIIQMLVRLYVFVSINTLHVVLGMSYTHSMKINSVRCVLSLQIQF